MIASNVLKICPVCFKLFHADGQPDVQDEANIRFSQFCETDLQKVTVDLGKN